MFHVGFNEVSEADKYNAYIRLILDYNNELLINAVLFRKMVDFKQNTGNSIINIKQLYLISNARGISSKLIMQVLFA